MVYTTGDTHSNQPRWVKYIEPVLKSGDILIINGDFGVGFWDGIYWTEELFFDYISEKDYTILFVDGNHENFDKLNSYTVEQWCGGNVHKIRHNLIHLMRGEVYHIEDVTIFTFGGGYSIDKYRRKENVSWWPQEMPSQSERDNALKNLENAGFQVDYIITHTAPSESVYFMSKNSELGITNDVYEELPLTTFLDDICRDVTYKHWYCGHFHIDHELWRNQTVVMNSIRELKTGKIVSQWNNNE